MRLNFQTQPLPVSATTNQITDSEASIGDEVEESPDKSRREIAIRVSADARSRRRDDSYQAMLRRDAPTCSEEHTLCEMDAWGGRFGNFQWMGKLGSEYCFSRT
ncbi:uncharacterized protein G2W53_015727 [Senna tora]|uniref:Uncharacterized protein n=1 Tax=Senna tora TaxID=362788 RepID=A0A834WVV4_9FABA|nr:uncharacterized protein G2W53_015727 [Senna tora]